MHGNEKVKEMSLVKSLMTVQKGTVWGSKSGVLSAFCSRSSSFVQKGEEKQRREGVVERRPGWHSYVHVLQILSGEAGLLRAQYVVLGYLYTSVSQTRDDCISLQLEV